MKREKLNTIISGTHDLFTRFGIKKITMDDVSRELGISKKTLYQYVTDKHDLVKKVVSYQVNKNHNNLETIFELKLNAVDTLLAVSKIISQMLKETNPDVTVELQRFYPDIFKIVMEYKKVKVLEYVATNIRQGQSEGYYRSDLNPDIISRLFLSRFDFVSTTPYFTSSSFQTVDVFKESMRYHIYGISSKKGIEYFENKMKNEPLFFLI